MAPPSIPIQHRLVSRMKRDDDGCWIWLGSQSRDGYGVLTVGRSKQYRAHRLSYMVFVGPIAPGLHVCHQCDVPLCINPEHLFLGTPQQNTKDMLRKGRRRIIRGIAHPNTRVSDGEVLEIKRLRDNGAKLNDLAERYGVSFQHISAICRGVFR